MIVASGLKRLRKVKPDKTNWAGSSPLEHEDVAMIDWYSPKQRRLQTPACRMDDAGADWY